MNVIARLSTTTAITFPWLILYVLKNVLAFAGSVRSVTVTLVMMTVIRSMPKGSWRREREEYALGVSTRKVECDILLNTDRLSPGSQGEYTQDEFVVSPDRIAPVNLGNVSKCTASEQRKPTSMQSATVLVHGVGRFQRFNPSINQSTKNTCRRSRRGYLNSLHQSKR